MKKAGGKGRASLLKSARKGPVERSALPHNVGKVRSGQGPGQELAEPRARRARPALCREGPLKKKNDRPTDYILDGYLLQQQGATLSGRSKARFARRAQSRPKPVVRWLQLLQSRPPLSVVAFRRLSKTSHTEKKSTKTVHERLGERTPLLLAYLYTSGGFRFSHLDECE